MTYELITVHVALELEDVDVSANEANIQLFNMLFVSMPKELIYGITDC